MTTIFNMDTKNTEYIYYNNNNNNNINNDGYNFPSPSEISSSEDSVQSPTMMLNNQRNNNNMSPFSDTTSVYNGNNTPSQNMSPISMNGSEQSYQFQNLTITNKNNETAKGPKLEIVEQPVEKFRFRYKSEMHGTHGSLTGPKMEKNKKTFPTVELRNYSGEAIIRCSLYQNNPYKKIQHSHSLVVKKGSEDFRDPHDVYVSPVNGYLAVFQGMGIIHTAKRFIAEELHKKLIEKRKFETNEPQLTLLEETKIKNQAEQEAKTMNLNQVVLCFEAFTKSSFDNAYVRLCEPVFSTPINNMKSALTGELKITRLSSAVSRADGGDDLFLFVEKVGKKNIKVRFYEVQDDEEVWQDWGRFSEADVHHQYAIALRTPPYRDVNIETYKDVYIQLYRPSDSDISEPVKFRYKPRHGTTNSRKRQRHNSNLSSSELPVSIHEQFNDNPVAAAAVAVDNDNQLLKSNSTLIGEQTTTIGYDQNNSYQQQQQRGYNNSQNIMMMNNNGYSEQITDDLRLNSDDLKYNSDLFKAKSGDMHEFTNILISNPDELMRLCGLNDDHDNRKLTTDGISSAAVQQPSSMATAGISVGDMFHINNIRKILEIHDDKSINDSDKKASIILYFIQDNLESVLHTCIYNNNEQIFNKYLMVIEKFQLQNDILQFQNKFQECCLHTACLINRPKYIKYLLYAGANPNITDNQGDTPLHIAVAEGNYECVANLLDEYQNQESKNQPIINILLTNDDGLTPLHLAVKRNNLDIFKLLIKSMMIERNNNTSLTDVIDHKNGNNLLHIAIEHQSIEICKFLLSNNKNQHNLNVMQKNASGYSPLELLECLLDDEDITIINRQELNQIKNKLLNYGNETHNDNNRSEKLNDTRNSTKSQLNEFYDENENNNECGGGGGASAGDNKSNDDIATNKTDAVNQNNSYADDDEDKITLDGKCLEKLCKTFNQSNKWKILAEILDFNSFIGVWSKNENPSKMLFTFLEMQGVSLSQLIDAFNHLNSIDGLDAINDMVARRLEETD